MADSIGYLYTIGGYAALFGFGYILWQVSTRKSKKRIGTAPTVKPVKPVKAAPPPETRREDKKKKQRLETFVSEGQEPSTNASKASKPKTAPEEPKPKARPVELKASNGSGSKDDGDDMDNREFARQLAKAQEGLKLASNGEGSKHREKSVKQSRANKIKGPTEDKSAGNKPAVPEVLSAPSSNGADADDDASPANSPEARPVDVSGVADMLEPVTAAGPSILRLTDTTSKKQKKVAKAPEPVETKKQRQNRKKNEAAKAAREEAEKERKILEEQQRRTARIAEGRPAKDGSEFTNGTNGLHSSWTHIGRNGAEVKKMEDSTLFEPLDTMESIVAKKEAVPTQQEKSWISSLPSEERQMEMLREESDEWSTVQTKSSRKAKKVASAADSGDENKTSQSAAQPKPAVAASTSAAAPTTTTTVKATKPVPAKAFGAFSALTVKEDFPDDLEEEWEV